MERHCLKGPESPEHQGGMGHWQGEMERSLQEPLPHTGRRRQKMRKSDWLTVRQYEALKFKQVAESKGCLTDETVDRLDDLGPGESWYSLHDRLKTDNVRHIKWCHKMCCIIISDWLPSIPERSVRVMHLGLFFCLSVCLTVHASTSKPIATIDLIIYTILIIRWSRSGSWLKNLFRERHDVMRALWTKKGGMTSQVLHRERESAISDCLEKWKIS